MIYEVFSNPAIRIALWIIGVLVVGWILYTLFPDKM